MAKVQKVVAAPAGRRTNKTIASLWNMVAWVTGVLVSLAVGFGMVGDGDMPILSIPFIPDVLTVLAGWVVVILTILGVILAIIDRLS